MADITTINTLARQEMLDVPKIYGPNSVNGPNGPPADLISALETLETAPANVGADAQTLTDLQTLTTATKGEIGIASIGAISENFIQELAFNYKPGLAAAEPAVVKDATQYTAGGKPPFTLMQPPAPPASGVEQYLVSDLTSGVTDWENGSVYSGPVAGVINEFAPITPDNLNITATKLNNFIHTGAGNDAINASLTTFVTGSTGTNVLDGGAGSNFLTGSSNGINQFYLDDRNPSGDTVSTVVNFKQGDNVTIFGVNKTDFQMAMANNAGASGFTGLDIGFLAAGHPDANVILTGYSSADLSNGKLAMSFGTTSAVPGTPGSEYMTIAAAHGTFPVGFI